MTAIDTLCALGEPTETLLGYRRVAQHLRQAILDGTELPGAWLRMPAVAARCGVSVQPVREALQLLEGEGLVEMRPNRGARVRGLDRERLVHIFEIREALESFAARRFAERATCAEIAALADIQRPHDAAVAAGDQLAVFAANLAFHAAINVHGGNHELAELVGRYRDLSVSLVRRFGRPPGYLSRVQREHHALLAAFRCRDAARAAEIGAAHVSTTCQEVLSSLPAPRSPATRNAP
ncbi:MAG: GntR family transcriptional regulator [Alphaproteobacteria bacterium]|nr:GntR family transcriptional regulator [Alphaproteobacteria bacterium]